MWAVKHTLFFYISAWVDSFFALKLCKLLATLKVFILSVMNIEKALPQTVLGEFFMQSVNTCIPQDNSCYLSSFAKNVYAASSCPEKCRAFYHARLLLPPLVPKTLAEIWIYYLWTCACVIVSVFSFSLVCLDEWFSSSGYCVNIESFCF